MEKQSSEVLKTIRREELIPAGSRVTVGFSGGADSVCLLAMLWELRALLECDVRALHVNHGLRGEEAERDQEFCRSFCEARNIPFRAVRVDVNGLVKEQGLSVEEAARQLRYEALQAEAGADGIIAVAHHAEDQAETILLNLLRGTGLKGLSGMEYRRGNIVRPLLGTGREQILSYLAENGLPHVTDSTNADNDYARNRLRNVILPEMEKINSKALVHLQEAGRKAAEALEYLEREAADYADRNVQVFPERGEVSLPRKKLKEEPQILRRYVIIESLRRLGIPLKDWGDAHIADIDRLLGGPRGKHLDLPGFASAETDTEVIILRKAVNHGKLQYQDTDLGRGSEGRHQTGRG